MSPVRSPLHATNWKFSTALPRCSLMISGYDVSYLAQYQSSLSAASVSQLASGAPEPMPAVKESPTAATRLAQLKSDGSVSARERRCSTEGEDGDANGDFSPLPVVFMLSPGWSYRITTAMTQVEARRIGTIAARVAVVKMALIFSCIDRTQCSNDSDTRRYEV